MSKPPEAVHEARGRSGPRVLVQGTGVAGLAVAYELVRRGVRVELAERAARVNSGASRFAGGMLAPYCEREASCETVLTLGLQAADWWEAVLPGLVQRQGTLVVAPPRDTAELSRFAARTTGYDWVDEAQIASLEPSLAGRFRKGLFFGGEAHLDPRSALAGLAEKLQAAGVRFRFGADDEPAFDGFDRVVSCVGAAAVGTLAGLRGVRGEMLYLRTDEVALSRPVRLLHPRHPLYIVPRGAGSFMVGATMVENDDAGPVSARSLMELLNAAYALHPAFGEARVTETGAGVRPAFADNIPRLVDAGRILHLNGCHRHGFLLAPAMARQAADIVTEGPAMRRAS